MIIGERDTDDNASATLVTSDDGGRSFSTANTLWTGTSTSRRVIGVGGIFASVPSYAISVRGKQAMVWDGVIGGIQSLVLFATDADGTWRRIGVDPPEPGTVEAFAQVAFDRNNNLWLLSARFRNRNVEFVVRTLLSSGWQRGVTIAAGPSQRYAEIGESLGFVDAGDTMIAAVPVDGPNDSRLVVVAMPIPPTSQMQGTSTTSTTTTTTIQNARRTTGTASAVSQTIPKVKRVGSRPGSAKPIFAFLLIALLAGAFTTRALLTSRCRSDRTQAP